MEKQHYRYNAPKYPLGDLICKFATAIGLAFAARPHHMVGMGKLTLMAALLALLGASLWLLYAVSTGVEWPEMPASAYVAMGLGIFFSLVVGCGLMALMFFSSRHGYDEAAHGNDRRE